MAKLTLSKTRIVEGVWEGVLSGLDGPPPTDLAFTHLGCQLTGLTVEERDDAWFVRAPIPVEQISEGVQVFVISDSAGEKLADFTLIAGEVLADDIRAEVALLREELDMLKRAFRRHCLETIEID